MLNVRGCDSFDVTRKSWFISRSSNYLLFNSSHKLWISKSDEWYHFSLIGRDIVLSGTYRSVCDLEVIRHQKETEINIKSRECFWISQQKFCSGVDKLHLSAINRYMFLLFCTKVIIRLNDHKCVWRQSILAKLNKNYIYIYTHIYKHT